MTLGSTAQTPMHWRPSQPNAASAARADGSNHDLARQQHRSAFARQALKPIASGFDVYQFEAMARGFGPGLQGLDENAKVEYELESQRGKTSAVDLKLL